MALGFVIIGPDGVCALAREKAPCFAPGSVVERKMAAVLRKMLGLSIALMVAASIVGCADTTGEGVPYPNLAKIKLLKDKVLSKEEQDAAMQDLSLEQENHRGKAIQAIEKR
jgi:hypothetical protein